MYSLFKKLHFLSLSIMMVLPLIVLSCTEQEVKSKNKSGAKNRDSTIQTQPDTTANQNTVFPQIHAHLKGMVSEFIFQIFQDQENNFWFCTNHDGVIRYDGKKLLKYTEKSGLGGSAVRSLAMDKTGMLWLGTSGGLTKFDGRVFTNFVQGNNYGDNEIWTLAVDKNNLIWIGTNNGASTFDGVKFTSFNVPRAKIATAKPMLSHTRIGKIFIDSKGHTWFITDGYGITRFDGKNFEFLTSHTALTDNNVTTVFEDSKGYIWIGTFNGGVSKYDGQHYTNFTKDGFTKGNEVSNFCEDQQGNIWFSAEGLGVYKYNGKEFTLFTTKDGLTTNTIQHIYTDKKGQIWFCTWQGISLYDGKSFRDVSEKEPWTK